MVTRSWITHWFWVWVVSCGTTWAASEPVQLNNFVSQLKEVSGSEARQAKAIQFNASKDGWVYVLAKGNSAGHGRIAVSIKGLPTENPLIIDALNREARGQFFVAEGEQTIEIARAGKAQLDELIVRQIPEIAFSKFGAGTRIASARNFGWPFLAKHILPYINTIVGMDSVNTDLSIRQWKAAGGRWFSEVSRPADPEEIFKRFGMVNSYTDGVYIDELVAGGEAIEKWMAALPQLKKKADEIDKEIRFYFAGDTRTEPAFVQKTLDQGVRVAWEKYFGEPAREPPGEILNLLLKKWMEGLRRSHPGVESNSVVCLSMMAAPPLSANRSAEIDFKVWLDLQLQFLATDPAFSGLAGVMEYITRYTDEESFRWVGLLFKHYCLDGKTNLLSDDYGFSYALKHIKNPDFREGLAHWEIEPRGATVTVKHVEHLGRWQGRYPELPAWDHAARVAPAGEAIRLKQKIQGLRPGRLYSAKLISVRASDVETRESKPDYHSVRLRIAGATPYPERAYRQMMNLPASGAVPPFTAENPLWVDYTVEIFYADKPSALVEIEVHGDSEPLLLSFVEVQPYLPETNVAP